MTKTREEIDAEKAAKPRPDLLPASALLAIGEGRSPEIPTVRNAYTRLLKFRHNLDTGQLWGAMLHVVAILGGGGAAFLDAGAVMGYGFRKHGKCTWRVAGTQQADPQVHLASAERHLLEHLQDHKATEEGSGMPVLWHALAQLCILYDLWVDPPQMEGVNDGKALIAPRPAPEAVK